MSALLGAKHPCPRCNKWWVPYSCQNNPDVCDNSPIPCPPCTNPTRFPRESYRRYVDEDDGVVSSSSGIDGDW